ncbi:MAG: hypothetical protein IT449_06700 [Phycisphaerales bacterium]|nr:hypothetical protein [Phycisphaerales bacterium]
MIAAEGADGMEGLAGCWIVLADATGHSLWWYGLLALTALVGLAGVRRLPRGAGWSLVVFSLSVLAGAWVAREGTFAGSLLIRGAWAGALLALGWATVGWVLGRAMPAPRESTADLQSVISVAAMTFGGGASVAMVVLLAMRLAHVAADLLYVGGAALQTAYDFPPSGAVILLILLSAGILLQRRYRSLPGGALPVVLWWLAVGAAGWLVLSDLPMPFPRGALRHATLLPALFNWSDLAAVLIVAAVAMEGACDSRRRRRWARVHPEALAAPRPARSGLHLSCALVGLMSILASSMHLALLPVDDAPWKMLRWIAMALLDGLCGAALLVLVMRRWSAGVAEVGLWLISIGIAGAASAFIPSSPASAVEQYPMLFNAVMAGFVVASAVWMWLAKVWDQQLLDGAAWTTAGRLIPDARRLSFLCGCLALLVGVLMALWPRFPAVAAADDRLGRFAAGVAVNLLALVVFARSARFSRRTPFHVLAALSVLSLLGFAAVRMLPFASSRG